MNYVQMLLNMLPTVATDDNELEGQGMVEYALILVLISIAAIVILTQFGGPLQDIFQAVLDELSF